ncbi:MAG: VanZ family protein [Flavobacteriaceae bacterium]|nr:VanZ family protein [Flavobacteriaceae bacterium]
MPIYWAFLTYILLKPQTEIGEHWFTFKGVDKIVHFGTFAVLGFLLMLAFPKIRFYYYFSIILIYAVLTEILQQQMNAGRTFEFLDILMDISGGLIGFYFYKRLKYRFLN